MRDYLDNNYNYYNFYSIMISQLAYWYSKNKNKNLIMKWHSD